MKININSDYYYSLAYYTGDIIIEDIEYHFILEETYDNDFPNIRYTVTFFEIPDNREHVEKEIIKQFKEIKDVS